jgi:hypothetical protein
MSLRTARKFRSISRVGLPLGAQYVTGWVVGDILYRDTGHLGLFYGPLGDLRRSVLAAKREHSTSTSPDWSILLPLAVWLAVLILEMRHQHGRTRQSKNIMLTSGYALGAVGLVGRLFGVRASGSAGVSSVVLVTLALSGVLLALGVWSAWSRRTRAAAVLVFVTGIGLCLLFHRHEDHIRLGSQSTIDEVA